MKMARLILFKGMVMLFAFCLLNSMAYAQQDSKLVASTNLAGELEISNGLSLENALALVEEEFDIVFIYGSETINGKTVKHDHLLPNKLEPALAMLLKDQAIKYRYLNPKTYGLYGPDEEVPGLDKTMAHLVSGEVLDAGNGEPLPGVNVVVKGTQIGAVTDQEGFFELEASSGQDSLVFSFVGYENKTVGIDGREEVNIQLKYKTVLISDITVRGENEVSTGYTRRKKENLTTSVGTVDMKGFRSRTGMNTFKALQGTVAGVNISSQGSLPGQDIKINIRGISTLSGDNYPLVLVDGAKMQLGLETLNPNDIESIQVLKDASAAAIYGAEAANGVLLVETKKGVPGKPRITYQNYLGVQMAPSTGQYDIANADEYITILQRMYGEDLSKTYNTGGGEEFEEGEEEFGRGIQVPQAAKDYLKDPSQFQSYDWMDLLYDNSLQQNHSLGVTGGGEYGNYRISGGYANQDGIGLGTFHERYNVHANTEFRLSEDVTIGQTIMLAKFGMEPQPLANDNSMIEMSQEMFPYFSPRNDNGQWRTSSQYYSGPGVFAEERLKNPFHFMQLADRSEKGDEISIDMHAELGFWDLFEYRVRGAFSQFGSSSELVFGDEGANQQEYFTESNTVRRSTSESSNWTLDNTFAIRSEINEKHVFDVMGGVVVQQETFTYQEGQKSDYISDLTSTLGAPGGKNASVFGGKEESAMLSFIGQVFYAYDDRYLTTFNFRRDGASSLAPENRWGNFPGGSIAWRISNEQFWESIGLSETVNEFKVRAGYGIIGRQNFSPYAWTPFLEYMPVALGGTMHDGLINGEPINRDIGWERQISKTIGLDFELFSGRVEGQVDVFRNVTRDMVIELFLPASAGGGRPSYNNGRMINDGFEVTLNYRDDIGEDFRFNAGFNVGAASTVISEMGTDEMIWYDSTPVNEGEWIVKATEGGGLVDFWLVETDGLFRSQEEIQNHVNSEGTIIQPDAKPGDVKFIDANDDGEITSDGDRINMGSGIPDMTFGFNLYAAYKSFDFSLNISGALGHVIYNAQDYRLEMNSGFTNFSRNLLNAYHPENNPNSDIPRLNPIDETENNNYRAYTDRYLENGDYAKIRNVEIGYNMPPNIASKLSMRLARFFVRAQNVATITGYSGLDPDVGGTSAAWGEFSQGIDRGRTPHTRSYQVGIELEF